MITGNEVIFTGETATDYVRNDKSVICYEWQEAGNGVKLLETELSSVAGMCAATTGYFKIIFYYCYVNVYFFLNIFLFIICF